MTIRLLPTTTIRLLLWVLLWLPCNTSAESTAALVSHEPAVYLAQGTDPGLPPAIAFHGLGARPASIGRSDTFNLIVDGAARSSQGLAFSDWLDVESVVVATGPDLLLPTARPSGAMTINHHQPSLSKRSITFGAQVENNRSRTINSVWNHAFSEQTSALRIGASFLETGGSVSALEDSGLDPSAPNETRTSNAENRKVARAQFLTQPYDGVSIRLAADYQKASDACCAVGILQGSTSLVTGNYFADQNLGANGGAIHAGSSTIKNRLSNSNDGFSLVEQSNYQLDLSFALANALLEIDSLYTEFDSKSRRTLENSALDVFRIASATANNEDSFGQFDDTRLTNHHLRISGESDDSKLHWAVGANYRLEKKSQVVTTVAGQDYQAYFSASALASLDSIAETALSEGLFADITAFRDNVATRFPNLNQNTDPNILRSLAGGSNAGSFATNRFSVQQESTSLYWHNLWTPIQSLKISGTLRTIIDKKEGRFSQDANVGTSCNRSINDSTDLDNLFSETTDAANSSALQAGYTDLYNTLLSAACPSSISAIGLIAPSGPVSEASRPSYKKGGWLGSLSGQYFIGDNTKLWGKVANSFQPGGINLNANINNTNALFDHERIYSYEMGMETALANEKLAFHLQLFHHDINDLQALKPFDGSTTRHDATIINIDRAMASGLSTAVTLNWTKAFQTSVLYSYTDTRTANSCLSQAKIAQAEYSPETLCGKRFGDTPESNAYANLNYRYTQFASRNILFNAAVRFESDQDLSERIGFANELTIKSTTQFDLSVTLLPKTTETSSDTRAQEQKGEWHLTLFAKNIGDQPIRNLQSLPGQPGSIAGTFGEPKRYGLSATLIY